MTKFEQLKAKVHELYLGKDPNRDEWTDWLYENHVLIVAKYARELAEKYGVNEELSEAAALLHDIADVKMSRFNETHEDTSLEIAKDIMSAAGYASNEIELLVEDAVRNHSCHDGIKPNSKEGLILATADALAHFKTDFYVHAAWSFGRTRTLKELKVWVLKKIERDLNIKISFEDERNEALPQYEAIKLLFSC